jgi:hypothetical protein
MTATATPAQVMPALKSLDAWAVVIRSDLDQAAQGLLAAGQHLLEAKAEHPGTFRSWLDSGGAGMKKSFAYMLMKIAVHPVSNMLDKVPSADVVSVYQLARLEPAQLESAVEAGAVTPEMSRGDVKQYVAREITRGKLQSRRQKTQAELEEITTYGKEPLRRQSSTALSREVSRSTTSLTKCCACYERTPMRHRRRSRAHSTQ